MSTPRARILGALRACELELDTRNALSSGGAARRRERLQELVALGRRPCIALLGRRGCGKSSLLNALLERPSAAVNAVEDTTDRLQRYELALPSGLTDWYDTPGLAAGGEPRRAEMLAEALRELGPEVLLVAVQASEADAGITDDFQEVQRIHAACAKSENGAPRIVLVATKVDELAPPDVFLPPYNDPEKQRNIERALELIAGHLRAVGLAATRTLALSAHVQFGPRGEILEDFRWNLASLTDAVSALTTPEADRKALEPKLFRARLAAVLEDLAGQWSSLAAASARRASKEPQARALAHEDLERVALRLVQGFASENPKSEGVLQRVGLVSWRAFDESRAALRGLRSGEDAAATRLGAACRREARAVLAGWDEKEVQRLFSS